MKVIISAVILFGLFSESANATKARMSALLQDYGTKSLGSFYLKDNRNIWRSASAVSSLDNHMTFEHGSNYEDATGSSQVATAEGGVFTTIGSHQVGLYINGNQGNGTWGNEQGLATLQPARFDVFFGKASFHDLGIRLGYAKAESDLAQVESYGLDFSVSGTLGGVELWLNYVPALESTVSNIDVKMDADMNLGFSYALGTHKLFAEYSEEGNNDSTDSDSALVVGLARVYSKSDHTSFYDIKAVSTDTSAGQSFLNIPLTFGVEAVATDWLTWRLSISQDIVDSGDDDTSARSTSVGAGAALTFGDLIVEGTLTNVQNTAVANTRVGTDGLLSNVSVRYNW